jgi:hypothetical protein
VGGGGVMTPEERRELAERVAELNRVDSAMCAALQPSTDDDQS